MTEKHMNKSKLHLKTLSKNYYLEILSTLLAA